MKPMTEAVLKSGLVTPMMLQELRRFGAPLPEDAEVSDPTSLEQAAELVQQALQTEGYVLVRETDLEVLRQYADTARAGSLHVEVPNALDGQVMTDIPLTYGVTPTGACIIPWRSEGIGDLLTNGLTYLTCADGVRVYFGSTRELYFGDTKAFMVCEPSQVEAPTNDTH